MAGNSTEILHDFPPIIRIFMDERVERLTGEDIVPASVDLETGVQSKDIQISPEFDIYARLYLPGTTNPGRKLPLLVYFHGGAFLVESPFSPSHHNHMNSLVAEANVVVVSVGYRLAPEHPLPIAYEDSWLALKWVASQSTGEPSGLRIVFNCLQISRLLSESWFELTCVESQFTSDGHEPWIQENADFDHVYLGGDSAGANIAHNVAIRFGLDKLDGINLDGIFLICPYFWGKDPIGNENSGLVPKSYVDNLWVFSCPNTTGVDDPLINPSMDLNLSKLGCKKVLIYVAENDILKERGYFYKESLMNCGWGGNVDIVKAKGESHVFSVFSPNSENGKSMFKRIALFVNN